MIYKKAKLTEKRNIPANPCRGMLQLFYHKAGEDWSYEEARACLVKDESLILLETDLSGYKNKKPDEASLNEIAKIIDFFTENNKDVILRPVYDNKGHALISEPSDYGILKDHLYALCRIIRDKNIFVIQGLMIGNWGEMHGSRYTGDRYLKELYAILKDNTGDEVFYAVRCPYHYRILTGGGIDRRLGLFDDAILSSETDMGTFAPEGHTDTGDSHLPRIREAELDFENLVCGYAPNGGEAVYGDGYVKTVSQRDIISVFRRMRLTYLNRLYDRKIIDIWENEKCTLPGLWKGDSFLEYIKDHLGYRLIIRKSMARMIRYSKGTRRLRITVKIQNTGFAPVYIKNSVFIIFKGPETIKCETQWDLGDIGREDLNDTKEYESIIDIPREKGKYDLYICAHKTKDRKPIYFANSDGQEQIKLGTVKI